MGGGRGGCLHDSPRCWLWGKRWGLSWQSRRWLLMGEAGVLMAVPIGFCWWYGIRGSNGSFTHWLCDGEAGVLMAVSDSGCGRRGGVFMAGSYTGCGGD